MKLINKKHDPIPSGAVYIGRGSKYGNPFSHLSYGKAVVQVGTRDLAIKMYLSWILGDKDLIKLVSERGGPLPPTHEDIQELEGKDLVCWCSPLPCHGQVLMELINNAARKQ